MGTEYWRRAIENKISAAGIDFKFVNYRLVRHTEINCRLFFDVKMDFMCKACYVASGNLTHPTNNVPTYASIISRKSIRILFLIDALYDIKLLVTDISNAFLNSQCAEKVCFKAGPEFKSCENLWAIIVHALYGLKSDGSLFRAHLANN